MRRFLILLTFFAIFAITAEGQMERGTKSESPEEIIMVGADDWHGAIAATPLAIWSEEEGIETRPLLIIPREIDAGERLGWIDQAEIERYGPASALHAMTAANVSALVIDGEGDLAKSLVEAAQKEGVEAYVTATLEVPEDAKTEITDEEILAASDKETALGLLSEMLIQDRRQKSATQSGPIPVYLRDLYPDSAQIAVDAQGIIVSDRLCPVDPDARDHLYNRVEEAIEDYGADGVVLYNFGFLDESHCLCDVCKEEFYNDTGVDLARAGSSSYNLQLWKRWKEEQVLEIVAEVADMTADLGPVKLGVAIGDPFDRSEGYNCAEISEKSDFVVVSPVAPQEMKVASAMTGTPVFVRLSDDYVEYIISTQNVEGTVGRIEGLVDGGATGMVFEYDVVYTPLWSELQPPSPSVRWLLERLDGKTLGIGDVFWRCNTTIEANDSLELAAEIASRWERSPGAVLASDNYSAGLTGAAIASYLNWPILFVGDELTNSTEDVLARLGATMVVTTGPVSEKARSRLVDLNLTVIEGDDQLLIREMKARGDEVESVVLANSHDLSLVAPKPEPKIERTEIGDDLIIEMETNPSEIPAEREGEIVRLEITLKNSGKEEIEDLALTDLILPARQVIWWSTASGDVELADPSTGREPTVDSAFLRGSNLNWTIDGLGSHQFATLNLEVIVLHALDAGWTQPLDGGITVTYSGMEEEVQEENGEVGKGYDDGPFINITYPSRTPPGWTEVAWEVAREPHHVVLNYYSPDGWSGSQLISDCSPKRRCNATVLFGRPGSWTFNLESWSGEEVADHRSRNFTVEVRSSASPINVTAFSHTKIPKLSLISAEMAGARRGIVVDVATDPQHLNPAEVEEDLQTLVDDLEISPEYLIVVGGPGSLPFITTGGRQTSGTFEYDIYREYSIELDDDGYQDVASGRMIGLSVYDASQMAARTLAYERIDGDWRDSALVISSPIDYPTWPASPIPLRIGEYLRAAGLRAENLRWEEATYQRVSSKMNSGENIVYFDYHGAEWGWQLSRWALMDQIMDEEQVKQLTLAPQTTTTSACLTTKLKGQVLAYRDGIEIYIPSRLEDSMALAFLKAGAVNYVGSSANSWIFVSDDHPGRMYQALVFENATIGEAMMAANNLYISKIRATEGVKLEDIDEFQPWYVSLEDMLNQTVSINNLFGDPAFRPTIPKTPELPYTIEVSNVTESDSGDEISVSIRPTSEWTTDWTYWIVEDTSDGYLSLNAPPALVGEVMLPEDAEEIVVKERGRAVWHGEEIVGEKKRVVWPVLSPALNESRSFTVEYRLVPGEVQVVNVSVGWSPFSLHLDPKDPSVAKALDRKSYRGIFTLSEDGWNYTIRDDDALNVTDLKPGMGYIIDGEESFNLEIPGKPVELPYLVELHQGWNLVGVPVNETVLTSNLSVRSNHRRYTYPEAVDEGIVSAFLWTFREGSWVHLNKDEPMIPGEAYMVEAAEGCRLEFG
ncbi:C25 family cysteine peptidase [Methanocrinis sp.]|uniref:C25 family cysteine peptidase n=1 Tax=Methanocrinis sp. TaxID=3101522 RepID=UPI003D1052FC